MKYNFVFNETCIYLYICVFIYIYVYVFIYVCIYHWNRYIEELPENASRAVRLFVCNILKVYASLFTGE